MHNYLPYLSDLIIITGIVLGTLGFRSLPVAARLVLAHLVVTISTEITGLYLTHVLKASQNIWLYNGYILVEFVLIMCIGYFLLPSKKAKALLFLALPLFLAVWIMDLRQTPSGLLLNFSFLIGCIILSSFFLWQLFNLLKAEQNDIALILLCLSVLIYFSCCIPIFSFFNYFLDSTGELKQLFYGSNHVLSIIRYGLIAFSFFSFQKKLKTLTIGDR